MSGRGEEDVCERIYKLFEEDGIERVVLAGKPGIGKTWVANEVCKLAKANGSCYIALRISLNKPFDERSLYEEIATQVSLSHLYEETEVEYEKGKEEEWHTLKYRIIRNLEIRKLIAREDSFSFQKRKKRPGVSAEKYLLLSLDDDGWVTTEDKVMTDLKLREFLQPCGPLKILITSREVDENSTNQQSEIGSDESESISKDPSESITKDSSDPLTKDETQALLDSLTDSKMKDLLVSHTNDAYRYLLDKTWGIDGSTLQSTIVKRSLCLPAAVVVLAKSLNCIALHRSKPERHEYIKKVFKEVVPSESQDAAACSESIIKQPNYILHLGYELLRNDNKLKGATVDCFWHSLDLFKHCGSVHYRDLITHWILEGYFDPVRSIKKAYLSGYHILMELMDRGFLKIQEDNMVVPEMAMSSVIDLRYRGFVGISRLGFHRVYGGDKAKGIGEIAQIDDMIKTVKTNKKPDTVSTFLVSGNRLRKETPEWFFEKREMKDLEVLGLFGTIIHSLVVSLSQLKKLRVLVIRDFAILNTIADLKDLKRLQVLEVSGASSLENISDDFFNEMTQLQSLNLSGLWIKSSPSSISILYELRCLILRDCPKLEDLPDVRLLKKLEVIDFRGAHELKTCFHKEKKDTQKGMKKNKSKNSTFRRLQQLQLLDFSESQIDRLPTFQYASESNRFTSLTRLLLRDCRNLISLPNLKPLSGLQVLDLSGTTSLVEILEVCFEDKRELRFFDLSGTNINELPSTISELSNLTQFLVKDCPNLEALPNIEELTRLEVFDVSGSTKLNKIEGSFKRMTYLRELNLRGTGLITIPELPEHSSLGCSKYIVLPDSRRKQGENWRQIKEDLASGTFESSSSSDAGAKTSEISEQESGRGQTLSGEPHSLVFPDKKGECNELVYHRNRYEGENIRQFVDPKSPLKIEEISSCCDPSGLSENDGERISKAEFVSIVNNFSRSVSSVFDTFQMNSVKGCWVNRCRNMEHLFSGEHEKQVELVEILWVSNLPLLKSLCSESPECGGFNNLKKLSIDCCPSIETLFPASQLPTSLEELHIKFCDHLKKVFDQDGEVPNLKMLHLFELPELLAVGARLPNLRTFTKRKCPNLMAEDDIVLIG